MTKRAARLRVTSLLARRDRHGVYLTRLGVQRLTAYVRRTRNRNRRGYKNPRHERASPTRSLEPVLPSSTSGYEAAVTPSCEPTPCLTYATSTPSASDQASGPLTPNPSPPATPPAPGHLSPREIALTARIAELEDEKQESACILAYNLDCNFQERVALFREQEDITHDLLEHCEARYERLRDRYVDRRRRHKADLVAVYDTCKRHREFFYRRLSQAITLLYEFTCLPDYADEDPQDIIDGRFKPIIDWDKLPRWIEKAMSESEDALGQGGAKYLRGLVGRLQRRKYGLTAEARAARRAAEA